MNVNVTMLLGRYLYIFGGSGNFVAFKYKYNAAVVFLCVDTTIAAIFALILEG